MVKTGENILLRISKIDELFYCCTWPLPLLWNALSLPKIRSSIATRMRYVGALFLVTIVSMILLSSFCWKILSRTVCPKIGYKYCEFIHGPAPVYRIFFGTFCFFLLLGICIINVQNSKSNRAIIHNKFWFTKMLLLALIVIGYLFVPRSYYTGEVWHFFGLNAAFGYIVLQFILLLDAIHTANTYVISWIEDMENRDSARYWYLLLWLPTVTLYAFSIFIVVNFYKSYSSQSDCVANLFFITFHVYMCLSATFISIHPVIQAARPKSGMLQSSVVCAYSSYTLWMTLTNEPDEVCNPTKEFLYPADPIQNLQILSTICITFFILTIFSTRIVEHPQYGKVRKKTGSVTNASTERVENRFEMTYNDEEGGVEYSYSFFLFTLALGSLYIMMSITNWYRPEEEENFTVKLMAGWGAVWIKLCSGMFCVFLYIWSMVAPVIFPYSYKDLCFYDSVFMTK